MEKRILVGVRSVLIGQPMEEVQYIIYYCGRELFPLIGLLGEGDFDGDRRRGRRGAKKLLKKITLLTRHF
jgi:hypothetical protein